MNFVIRAVVFVIMVVCCAAVRGQQSPAQDPALLIPGLPYDVPEIKVYLTDEETKEPFANKEVYVEYFWGWEVLKLTPEADRMERLKNIMIKAHTDSDGLVIVPAKIIIPMRAQSPEGAEFSEPTFQFVEIEVQDTHHNCGLFIDAEDIEKYRAGAILDFHRTVPIWKRTSTAGNIEGQQESSKVESGIIKGKVFRSDTNGVIPNSYIFLMQEKDSPAQVEHSDLRTDKNGDYCFNNIPSGKYTVFVYAWFPNKSDVPCQNPSKAKTVNGDKVKVEWQRKSGAFMEIVTIKGFSVEGGQKKVDDFDLVCK